MNKPVNPCRVNGVDCPKRHGGCAVGCKDWQTYEAERGQVLQNAKNAYLYKRTKQPYQEKTADYNTLSHRRQ